MALVSCQECNNQISDKAAACPQCGCPPEGTVISLPRNEYKSSDNTSSSGGCATIFGGIAMIAVGGLVCLIAFKVFNFIIGAVGGVLALIGFALMSFAG
jgi:hypothetical protein